MTRYFGTDGIRGVAGEFPLDPPTVFAIGSALGAWLCGHRGPGAVLLGQDTRESGRWIAETLAAALQRQGCTCIFAGVITTPGIAYLTRHQDVIAGVMISASHNHYLDNGIKIFGHDGYKLPDAAELEIEARIQAESAVATAPQRAALQEDRSGREAYLDFLAGRVGGALSGLSLVLDCAHGAASELAPALLRRLGCRVHVLNASPSGRNINQSSGSLHPEAMAEAVLARDADCGLAFDGDADRVIFADEQGHIMDGDEVLLILARAFLARQRLQPPLIISTVMSNLALELALQAEGIQMRRTAVGDKYVLQSMLENRAQLGGEPSGHVICLADATTGDGLLTGLRVLELLDGHTLTELRAGYRAFPQQIINVRVREKRPMDQLPAVRQTIADAENFFQGAGRVLVRYSGTEPLARVMVEANDDAAVRRHAGSIAAAIQTAIGV